jgi:hypothetical protein
LIGNAIAVGNPGVLNHDEIQAYEEVHAKGVLHYAAHYAINLTSGDFGRPVRPLGRAIWGALVSPYPQFPVLAHLLDVLTHLLNAVLVAVLASELLRHASNSRRHRLAALAGILFAVSPLTSFATAWSAASFDRTYTTFSLLCVLSVSRWLCRVEAGIGRPSDLGRAAGYALATGGSSSSDGSGGSGPDAASL